MKLGMTPQQMEKKAREEFFIWNDAISDIDHCYNPETDKYDIPTIEWSGMYGNHWVKYSSEQAMQDALNKHKAEMDSFVAEKIASYKNEQSLLRNAKRLPNQATFTLGDIFLQKFLKIYVTYSNNLRIIAQ